MNERKEYVIMHQGYYIQEHYKEGMFFRVRSIKNATMFQSLESVVSYIENDLKLNITSVSIHEIKTTITETPLVKINGVFVDIKAVGYCNHEECKKPYYLMDLQYFQIDNDSKPQLYCSKHYNELNDKWNNSYHGNQDSDTP
jgi:hypothetical protein